MPTRMIAHVTTSKRMKRPDLRPSATERGYCDRSWFALRQIVLVRDAYACRACGRVCAGKREAQVDHIKPKREGGSDDVENLQTLCIRCHARKTYREQKNDSKKVSGGRAIATSGG